jgi:hypothetical protein
MSKQPGESERQARIREDVERGLSPAEARGREAAREAGVSLPPSPIEKPSTRNDAQKR